MTVGGLVAEDMELYLIVNQTETFAINPFDGIQGLSPQSLFAKFIDQGLPSLFGMYLTPLAVGNAELTIGEINESKSNGSLTYVLVAWLLESPGVSVNGETACTQQTREVVFDSGRTSVLFDTATIEAIYALISPDIQPFADEPGACGIACNKIDSLPAVVDLQPSRP